MVTVSLHRMDRLVQPTQKVVIRLYWKQQVRTRLTNHFPDPMEVGAYQIIIQPNVFSQQITGYHLNHSDATKAPSESGDKVTELTGQQVNTVIAIRTRYAKPRRYDTRSCRSDHG